jgi:acyl-homoserine lactone synthase
MPIVIDESNATDHSDLLRSCFAFRRSNAEEFILSSEPIPQLREVTENGQTGAVRDIQIGLARQDCCDGQGVAHFVAKNGDEITAYCRLVPTTGNHPGATIYPQIFGIEAYPSGPGIGELSPIILLNDDASHHKQMELCQSMVGEMMAYCKIRRIWGLIFTVEASWLTWLLGCGYEIVPLGLPCQVQGKVMVPLRMRVG